MRHRHIGATFFLLAALLCSPWASAVCGKTEHTTLTDAHRDAARTAQQFYEDIDHLSAIDKPDALRRTDLLAQALDRVHEAEKKCTAAGAPHSKVPAWNYQQMLDHQRMAYDDLVQLRQELSASVPRLNHVISVVADIARQIEIAEEAHCDCRAT